MRNGWKINDEIIEGFITRYLEGMRVVDIAEELNVGKSTLYDLLKDDEFVKRLEADRTYVQNQSRAMIMRNATKYIKNIQDIADSTTDVRSKLKANEVLLAYIIGTPTARIEVNENDNTQTDKSLLGQIYDMADEEIQEENE